MIKLYTIGCPKCKVLEKKLQTKGIKFDICDDKNMMLDKGFSEVPMLEVDGVIMNYKEAVDFINKGNE